jgi:hypothetical protein
MTPEGESERAYPSAAAGICSNMRTGTACVFLGVSLLAAASSCGNDASRAAKWHSCPRPPSAADIRQFRVKSDQTCARARRVLGYTAFGHEGMCGPCHYLGFTCTQRAGGLKRNSFGGSYYTYEDDLCVRGPRRAAWRIVYH